MPKDSSDTRAQLLAEAERLFAERGIWQVPAREIVAAAGQRNSSAISYHFGSRDGVVEAILQLHGDPIDRRRGELLVDVDESWTTVAIIDALVEPMVGCFESASGRRYVQIVAQLLSTFGTWRGTATDDWTNLTQALTLLEARPPALPEATRKERTMAMILLMTASLAERARVLSGGRAPGLSADAYRSNLTDILVGVIEAPARSLI